MSGRHMKRRRPVGSRTPVDHECEYCEEAYRAGRRDVYTTVANPLTHVVGGLQAERDALKAQLAVARAALEKARSGK